MIAEGGTYLVGADIQSGTYRNAGGCYWARLSGVSGEFDDIISNGGVGGGPTVVEIAATDHAFETRCGGWARAS